MNLSQLDISCRQVNFVALETPHDKLNVAAVVYIVNTASCALHYNLIDQPNYLARLTLERSGSGVIWNWGLNHEATTTTTVPHSRPIMTPQEPSIGLNPCLSVWGNNTYLLTVIAVTKYFLKSWIRISSRWVAAVNCRWFITIKTLNFSILICRFD